MNLFKNTPKIEGESISIDSYLVFGKYYRRIEPTHVLYMGETLPVGTQKRDGWHLTINMPFIRQRRKYMCPEIFEIKEDICTPIFMIRIRKMGKNKYYSMYKVFVWKPMKQDNKENK